MGIRRRSRGRRRRHPESSAAGYESLLRIKSEACCLEYELRLIAKVLELGFPEGLAAPIRETLPEPQVVSLLGAIAIQDVHDASGSMSALDFNIDDKQVPIASRWSGGCSAIS